MDRAGRKGMASLRRSPGVGLDIGTMFLCVAEEAPDKTVVCRKIRDAFIEVDKEDTRMLKLSKISTVEHGDRMFVVGDDALAAANLFRRRHSVDGEDQQLRRPIQSGIISATEPFSKEVLMIIIKQLLGEPVVEKEKVFFSVPATPIDVPGQDVVFHQGIIGQMLKNLGYEAVSMNEAESIVYSECEDTNFSAIATSFGSGMTNVKVVYKAIGGTRSPEFSIARGGDWIDKQAALAVNTIPSRVCAIKELGMDARTPQVGDPKTFREREAVAVYYHSLVKYVVQNTAVQFVRLRGDFMLPEPIPWVVSGGTSLVGGFLELFNECLSEERKKGFPIDISEVRAAKSPLEAVARGLLVASLL